MPPEGDLVDEIWKIQDDLQEDDIRYTINRRI